MSAIDQKLSVIRVTEATKSILDRIIKKANQKEMGVKIKPDDIISVALELVTDRHIENIQEKSYSNEDRLEIRYRSYQMDHGPVSKDQFIGALLDGTLEDGNPSS